MKEKKVWFLATPYKKELVGAALETGIDTFLLLEDNDNIKEEISKFGRVNVKTLKDEDIEYIKITKKEDEERAAKVEKGKKVIVETTDWTIIPLENILAQKDEVYVIVKNLDEAKTAFEILEKGVEGVILKLDNINDIKKVSSLLEEKDNISLEEITITKVLNAGMGDRVCVDTTSILKKGEGMLVGNSSGGMFLVGAETEENPYVASRPFRVNAGAVHMYTRVPKGKTSYLCELESSKPVMVYDFNGNSRVVYVGRAKVERRPMLYIEGKSDSGKKVSAILQNAETIRLVAKNGDLVSVSNLKKGDKVLGYTEAEGRHFGIKVEESITEK